MSRLLAPTLLVALTCATIPAHAGGPASIPDEAPVEPTLASEDWDGLHFGIAIAKPLGDNAYGERSGPAESAAGDWSGNLPTLSLGHDWQRGGLVYGVTLAAAGGDMSAVPTPGAGFACAGCETTVENLVTLQGRLGFATGKTLLFASAGAARAKVAATALSGGSPLGDDSLSGWTAGIGVERFVGQKVTISAEYLKTDLGRMELPTNCGFQCYTDVDFGQLKLGVNYRW